MKMGRPKIEMNKELKIKIGLLFILTFVLVAELIYSETKRLNLKQALDSQKEEVVDDSETNSENVPNFGTLVKIKNLNELATPLLKEDAILLEECLSDYYKSESQDEQEALEASIFYVSVSEENSQEIHFYVEMSKSKECIHLCVNRATKEVNIVEDE